MTSNPFVDPDSGPTSADLVWAGPLYDMSGYGTACRRYVRALRGRVDLRVLPVTHTGWRHREKYRPEFVELELRGLDEADIRHFVNHQTPEYYVFPDAAENVHGYSVLEANGVHEMWHPYIKATETMFTASEFCKEQFAEYASAVKVVPHGVDERFQPAEPHGRFADDDRFTFLSVFQWTYRKGKDLLVRAFCEEFDSSDDVHLVLRCYINMKSRNYPDGDEMQIRQDIATNDGAGPHMPDITIIPEMVDDMVGLYNAADVFVLPSRGEGFGLPYLESMACGTPCIATDWGGHRDFLDEDNGLLIDLDGLEPCQNMPHMRWYDPRFDWADPSLESLKAQMRTAYENPGRLETLGERARETASEYTWSAAASELLSHLDGIEQEPSQEMEGEIDARS